MNDASSPVSFIVWLLFLVVGMVMLYGIFVVPFVILRRLKQVMKVLNDLQHRLPQNIEPH